ncbi:YveK family protein [Amycolatopsis azurea]|uniref:YveK family protein n=1 Tax=Amycolatopsis azurea TaxID=36819 RepID=UPI0038118247
MSFADIVRIIVRRWVVVLIAVAFGVVAGFTTVSFISPTYTAEVSLLIDRENALDTGGASQDLLQRMPTFAALATTAVVLDPVVTQMSYPGGGAALRPRVSAVAVEATLMLRVTVSDPDPAHAARLADAVAASYTEAVRKSFRSGDGQGRVVVATVQPAVAPATPTSPSIPLFVAAGGVAALVITMLVLMTSVTMRRTQAGRNSVEVGDSARRDS